MLQRTYWMMYLEPSSSPASSRKERPSGQGRGGTQREEPTLHRVQVTHPGNKGRPLAPQLRGSNLKGWWQGEGKV